MERLTKKEHLQILKGIEHKSTEMMIYEKLGEYEDAEENGLLFRFPCKVGDEVYLINHSFCEVRKIPLKCVVDEYTFDKNDCYAVLNGAISTFMMRRFKAINIKKFGTTVFLSQKEAEQALAKLHGKD